MNRRDFTKGVLAFFSLLGTGSVLSSNSIKEEKEPSKNFQINKSVFRQCSVEDMSADAMMWKSRGNHTSIKRHGSFLEWRDVGLHKVQPSYTGNYIPVTVAAVWMNDTDKLELVYPVTLLKFEDVGPFSS